MVSRVTLRRIATPPLVAAAVLIVLFESTFWRWMTVLGHWLARRLPMFTVLERLVERASPRLVGAVFIIPLALHIPVELTAAALVVRGHVVSGVALAIAAKVAATAFSARLFALAKPKLMQLRSFAWAYGHVTRWIAFAHAYVDALPAWRRAKAVVAGIRRRWGSARAGLLRPRFSAALRRAVRWLRPV
jgi:hypothetical protein